MSKIECAEVYNPWSWPTTWEVGIEYTTSLNPYSEIKDNDEIYEGDDSHEQHYKREICYWSSPRGRSGSGRYFQFVYDNTLYYHIPFNKEKEFELIQEDFIEFGNAKVLKDIPKVPNPELAFQNFFRTVEGLVILYFESCQYKGMEHRNFKRDFGLYYHSEKYIRWCLSKFSVKPLFNYKQRVINYNTRPADHLFANYYMLLV